MMMAPSDEDDPELAAGVQLALDCERSTRTLADWAVPGVPRSRAMMSATPLADDPVDDWVLLAVQGITRSRNGCPAPVSIRFPVLVPGPVWVPPK